MVASSNMDGSAPMISLRILIKKKVINRDASYVISYICILYNVKYSGSAYCALYLYKYCYKGSSKREHIALDSEKEQDSLNEIKLFMYGRIMSSMSAMWRLYGYQDYPASEPPVVAFKVCTLEQLKDFIRR
jgi:hypothetical protein